jgi:DNA-binding PadR family transcriptional regulator
VHDGIPALPRKERLILELLVADGPKYGLQLVEQSDGKLKRGTVYVTLGRMEAKGLVESQQEPLPAGAIGLPRRLYRPTALGARMLRAWTTFARELAWEMKP